MTAARIAPGPPVILCADDYAISEAVSAGIEELAEAGRLSAVGCMVTFPEWPRLAQRIAHLRDRVAVGLHLNLTVGAPVGPMPKLAPGGELPGVGTLIASCARGAIDPAEIGAEVRRQLDAFAQATGHAPDFVDGHQHVHALPGLRNGVLAALREFDVARRMLVRDPSDKPSRIVRRKMFIKKAMSVSALALGFAKSARAVGFAVNDGFSGFSDFDTASPYDAELEAAFTASGPRHLAMCHPGHTDALLAQRDSNTVRREQEFAALMAAEGLAERLWRPDRARQNLWRPANG